MTGGVPHFTGKVGQSTVSQRQRRSTRRYPLAGMSQEYEKKERPQRPVIGRPPVDGSDEELVKWAEDFANKALGWSGSSK